MVKVILYLTKWGRAACTVVGGWAFAEHDISHSGGSVTAQSIGFKYVVVHLRDI